MLNLNNYSEKGIVEQRIQEWLYEARLNYFAREIMRTLAIEDEDEISFSLNRAFRACAILNIPVHRNFKRVYCFDGKNLIADWKISVLACYLIVINCDPSHESAAKAQLYFAMNKATKK
ncbi:MAG: hypothetical protein ABIN89_29835 [Chitinophagaceae bacterium]